MPDPREGVGIDEEGNIRVDDKFVTQLEIAHVPHDPAKVKGLQGEVYFEGAAKRYNNLGEQIATLQDAQIIYTQTGAAPEEIAKITNEIAQLQSAREKLGSANWNGKEVQSRAGEMTAAEGARQERLAKRDALSLEPVAKFFGDQVGGYRKVIQAVQAGLAFANAATQTQANPEAAQAAMAEADKWMNIPTDVRNSVLSGRPLTDEQMASIHSSLAQTFEEFDYNLARMRDMADAQIPEINTQIRDTLLKVAQAKVDKNMPQVLIADVLSTLEGGTGATGNLKTLAENQILQQHISAIQSFAKFIGDHLQSNQALFNWLADPSKPRPLIPAGVTMGTSPETLNMILNEVARNPEFASSVMTLIEASDKKLS